MGWLRDGMGDGMGDGLGDGLGVFGGWSGDGFGMVCDGKGRLWDGVGWDGMGWYGKYGMG